ncbi:MAG: hypothetical protein O3C60_17270, partial [Planctomycetota bacterium]|nr:hypothetical protein [Planctomycetota bacterium]
MRKFGILLSLVGVVMGGAQQASAAVAAWSEEMDALPGTQWGLHDDFQDSTFKNNIELDDLDGNGGTGIWKHPLINYNLRPQFNISSQGMVLVAGNDNPINALPSMAGPAPAQYTAEIRYKIITPLPAGSVGNGNDSFWFNVGGGNGAADSGADVRSFEGNYDPNGFTSVCGEGFLGCDPGYATQPFAGTSRGDWHTMRVIQDEVAQT